MKEALKEIGPPARKGLSRRSISLTASDTSTATSNIVRAVHRLIGPDSTCARWRSTLITACVPARLPELSSVRTRAPTRSNTVILQNLAMLSTPALVRESEARTRPPSSNTPTQYVIHESYVDRRRRQSRPRGQAPSGGPGDGLGFFGHDLEFDQLRFSEGGCDGAVRGVTSTCHQDASDARNVVASIEGVPTAAEECLEPGAEIHGRGDRWHADVAQVTGGVAGRNVHASAQRDGEVGEVPADAHALLVGLESRAGRAREGISEGQMPVDVVHDGLNATPAPGRAAEGGPGELREAIGLAVAAARQEADRLLRQLGHRDLLGRGGHLIRTAAILDHEAGPELEPARGSDGPGSEISERVGIGRQRGRSIGTNHGRSAQITVA